jgi:hypothetical protein
MKEEEGKYRRLLIEWLSFNDTVPCRSQPVLLRVGQYSICTGLVAAKGVC